MKSLQTNTGLDKLRGKLSYQDPTQITVKPKADVLHGQEEVAISKQGSVAGSHYGRTSELLNASRQASERQEKDSGEPNEFGVSESRFSQKGAKPQNLATDRSDNKHSGHPSEIDLKAIKVHSHTPTEINESYRSFEGGQSGRQLIENQLHAKSLD